jgi:hypothetical protein
MPQPQSSIVSQCRSFENDLSCNRTCESPLLRMMKFYGLEVDFAGEIKVTRAPNFTVRATIWLSPGNHNHLGITRILRCLSLLGLEAEARAFFECLPEIYENEQSRPLISTETILYWRRAVGDAGC